MTANSPTLPQHFNDIFIKTAMIDEMARADHWQGLDECLEFKPEAIKNFARYADAALRAIRNMPNLPQGEMNCSRQTETSENQSLERGRHTTRTATNLNRLHYIFTGKS